MYDWKESKIAVLRRYKFTIAFENESHPGYVTEKILHAMLAGSIPIYWGSASIARDFNPRAFINVHEFRSFEDVIVRIIAIDQNEDLYHSILAEPWYINNTLPSSVSEESLSDFLKTVVSQRNQKTPVAKMQLKSDPRSITESLFGRPGRPFARLHHLRAAYLSWKYLRPA